MPYKPMKPCKYPGCPNLTHDKYCENHRSTNKDRASSSQRGYGSKWQKARARFLKINPFCVRCYEKGKIVEATVVDHLIPHRGDQALFWDESNWQPLCKKCHDRKTMTEERYQEYSY